MPDLVVLHLDPLDTITSATSTPAGQEVLDVLLDALDLSTTPSLLQCKLLQTVLDACGTPREREEATRRFKGVLRDRRYTFKVTFEAGMPPDLDGSHEHIDPDFNVSIIRLNARYYDILSADAPVTPEREEERRLAALDLRKTLVDELQHAFLWAVLRKSIPGLSLSDSDEGLAEARAALSTITFDDSDDDTYADDDPLEEARTFWRAMGEEAAPETVATSGLSRAADIDIDSAAIVSSEQDTGTRSVTADDYSIPGLVIVSGCA